MLFTIFKHQCLSAVFSPSKKAPCCRKPPHIRVRNTALKWQGKGMMDSAADDIRIGEVGEQDIRAHYSCLWPRRVDQQQLCNLFAKWRAANEYYGIL